MRNKIQLIDVSILSTYMGRGLTLGVAILVLAITVSALLDKGGGAARNVITVCLAADNIDGLDAFEPFRHLLAGETRRPVVVVAHDGALPAAQDLYVLPVARYFELGEREDVEVVAEVLRSDPARDAAVLVTKASDTIDVSTLRPDDVAFTEPTSPNGCWLPLMGLVEGGLQLPATGDGFHFVSEREGGARIILDVVHGEYSLGACRLDDVDALVRNGTVQRDEIAIYRRWPALPEVVIVARRDDAAYYRRKLARIGSLLADDSKRTPRNETARLLKSHGIRGLRPLEENGLSEVRELYERFRRVFPPAATRNP